MHPEPPRRAWLIGEKIPPVAGSGDAREAQGAGDGFRPAQFAGGDEEVDVPAAGTQARGAERSQQRPGNAGRRQPAAELREPFGCRSLSPVGVHGLRLSGDGDGVGLGTTRGDPKASAPANSLSLARASKWTLPRNWFSPEVGCSGAASIFNRSCRSTARSIHVWARINGRKAGVILRCSM